MKFLKNVIVKKDNIGKSLMSTVFTPKNPKLTLHKHLKEEIQPKIGKSGIDLDAYISQLPPMKYFVKKIQYIKPRNN